MDCSRGSGLGASLSMSMSSFAERQAALVAQVLGGFTQGPEFCPVPCDLPLIEQEEQPSQQPQHCVELIRGAGLDGAALGGACDIADVDLQWQWQWQYQLPTVVSDAYEPSLSLPELVVHGQQPERTNYQIVTLPAMQAALHSTQEEDAELPAWQSQPTLSEESYGWCREPPAKRPRIATATATSVGAACYTLDDIMKKLPRSTAAGLGLRRQDCTPTVTIPLSPQFSSDLSLASSPGFSVPVSPNENSNFDEKQKQQQRQGLQQSCRKPPYSSVEPQSIAARHRRTRIREKIRCLEELVPLNAKLDTAKMLEEAIKYVKFLQAQAQVLECMPTPSLQSDTMQDVKPVVVTPSPGNNFMDGVNFPLGSNANVGPGPSSSWNGSFTNSFVPQRSASSFANKLSAGQMLHILLTSDPIQRMLFRAEKCIGTMEQKETLANSQAVLPVFSTLHGRFKAND